MVNTQLLEQKIIDSGVTKAFIARKLDISPSGLWKKIHNKSSFRLPEVNTLCDILRVGNDERCSIFLP